MRIVFASAFRDAAESVPTYFRQIAGLYFLLVERGHTPYLLLGEGDSRDYTREALNEAMEVTGLAGRIVDCTHDGPRFGHVIHPRRFAQLAGVYNKLWAHIPEDAAVVVFCEGDLLWQPETMMALIERLEPAHDWEEPPAAVAPMIYDERRGEHQPLFYDTWGMMANGVNFVKEPPYHAAVNGHPIALDSAGSCVVMRADVARRVCFPAEDMVVGMTKMLAAQGNPVYLQTDLEIEHPHVPRV